MSFDTLLAGRRARAVLTTDRLLELYRHARRTYPEECCGMVLESGPRPCRNAQDDLHRLAPNAFPQTAGQAFCFDAADQVFLAECMGTPDPVLVVYHSHPDAGDSLSSRDMTSACRGGAPMYPRLSHLVIDCRSDRIAGASLYLFVKGCFRKIVGFSGKRW